MANDRSPSRQTLSIKVENRYGELARIVGLFGARGLNIESLTVAETLDPAISCVTLVTSGDDAVMNQIVKQLEKLVRVLEVEQVLPESHIQREMLLIRIQAGSGAALHQVLSLASANRLKVVEAIAGGVIVEASGEWSQISGVITALSPLAILEVVRTGVVAIPRKPQKADSAQVAKIHAPWVNPESSSRNRHPISD